MKRITVLLLSLFVAMLGTATNYYVSSTAQYRSDSNLGTSPDLPWATMGKVNGLTFNPGDTVRFYGTITDQVMYDPGNGSQAAPIVFMGMEPNNGRAVISGIILSNTQYVEFLNFECANHSIQVRTVNTSTNPVKFIQFKNLYLHNGIQGVAITIPTATDITFENTTIDQMDQDGILLSDPAGDRFSYIGGSITNTGNVNPGFHVHGCYASGGTGHLFDGVTFRNNAGGCAISMRRGGITIRNCQFFDIAYTQYIGNVNEDEANGINHFTGSRAKNQYYKVYHNLFVGGDAIYQSDKLYNGADLGVDDPGNIWAVFNNTFVNSGINFSGSVTTNYSRFYDIYMRNNVFVNTTVRVGDANEGKNHVLSNNGWFGSTYNGTTTFPGTGNLITTPSLDAQNNVTEKAYRDAGTKDIAPERIDLDMPAISMVTDIADPLYYLGSNPDIGKNEYDSTVTPNIFPVAVIEGITPNPAFYGSVVSFRGTGADTDGTIAAYEWSSSINGIFSSSKNTDFFGLNAGTHVITFRVKDDRGDWSIPVVDTLIISSNPTSLVADWKFNENAGDVATDNSNNGNAGTLTNSPTWTTGKIGSALNFTDSYVNIPGSTSLNTITGAITLSAWIKASANTATSSIIERWLYGTGVNQRAFNLYVGANGKISFGLSKDGTSTNSKWLTTTATITRDVWTYVTATFDGITMKIYLNGVLSTSVAAGFSTIFVPTGNVHIGKWQTTATTLELPFIGAIDEVKIFNEALSSGEIKDLYNDIPLSVEEVSNAFSTRCYPNPFSSSITIDYNVSQGGKVMIEIYNLTGQLIQRLVDEDQSSMGKHSVTWNADNLADGLYLCKIHINGNKQVYKILKK